ncbi:MAG: succinate dehydrogenase/fumarate reductase iron-sulfur subunit [Burkholderiales bacterium]|nr:succinate dehydrogenase/fumarate reductase iron-sulfur subunit [Burkholderiales bacterium]
MGERTVEFEVLRYNPEKDAAPHFQRYSVKCREEWVVLDALNHIKESVDPTLSYRWSCHMAVCGSCGMMVNGEPKLACKSFLRDYPGLIRVEPLRHFPVERDLVTVIDDFVAKLARVKPFLIPQPGAAQAGTGEYAQTPAQLKRYKQFTLCINCMLCYAACPEYGLIPEYIGPAVIALGHRWNEDSRDGGRAQRQEELAATNGVWDCSFVGACSEVCPEHVDPAAAIQQVKIKSTIDWYTEHLMPWLNK